MIFFFVGFNPLRLPKTNPISKMLEMRFSININSYFNTCNLLNYVLLTFSK